MRELKVRMVIIFYCVIVIRNGVIRFKEQESRDDVAAQITFRAHYSGEREKCWTRMKKVARRPFDKLFLKPSLHVFSLYYQNLDVNSGQNRDTMAPSGRYALMRLTFFGRCSFDAALIKFFEICRTSKCNSWRQDYPPFKSNTHTVTSFKKIRVIQLNKGYHGVQIYQNCWLTRYKFDIISYLTFCGNTYTQQLYLSSLLSFSFSLR